ncbi:MAG: aldehyde ferredoxin oxidoreductase [Armatimonadetes bacterium]|nr:aldehyde ferredoxin oxidoreductase [Armatimonadota bacterium]
MNIFRVDVNASIVHREEVPQDFLYLGGRRLTAEIISREVPPRCHPLGEKNKVVIAPGLLTGSIAPSSGRLSVGTKSPLTGTIKESNVGGTAGQALALWGVKAIVIEGVPSPGKSYLLEIGPGGVELKDAGNIRGMGNYVAAGKLRDIYGPDVSLILTGPAGERKFPVSTVAVTDLSGNPSRHAGRGGVGAVLGAKGIKAIVIKQPAKKALEAKDKKGFSETCKVFAESLYKSKKTLREYGTASLVDVVNAVKGLPVNNFSRGCAVQAASINGEKLASRCKERGGATGKPCSRSCVIQCSNVYRDPGGKYVTSGLEYETLVLMGSNCGIFDLDEIAELDFLCDDLGIDTMETGAAIAVAMDAGLLPFGDAGGAKRLVEEIGKGTLLGKVLGQGALVTGKVLGVARVPVVKGQALSAYDPRVFKGTGVTYATSPMGADHTAGNCLPGRGGVNISQAEGQIKVSKDLQVISGICDMLGLCIFVGPLPENLDTFASLVSRYTGESLSGEDLCAMSLQMLKKETSFNFSAGISPVENDVPEFMREEPNQDAGFVFDVPKEELHAFWD